MEERSAGAILFHEDVRGRKYLLLKYPAGHWDFPKGNIEAGEKEKDTVMREVWEETGLKNVSPVGDFKKRIEYYYHRDGKRVHKEVTFILLKSSEDRVRLSYEHRDFGWFRLSDALRRVTYSNSKRLLLEAEKFLATLSSKYLGQTR